MQETRANAFSLIGLVPPRRPPSRNFPVTDPAEPSSSPNSFSRWLASPWLLAIVIFCGTLYLDTRFNGFPFSYHPDEGGKVEQLILRSRNYHHPLLMLETAEYTSRIAMVPRQPQPIVETGRWVIAAFAAGTAVALGLLAWRIYGALAGWGAGIAVALQADLFEMAHYFKEDPTLSFGIALSLFAAHLWWRTPERRTLRFLAIACGLATAGKYLGIVVLVFALPMVLWHRAADGFLARGKRVKAFALIFVVTFLIANLPLFAGKISSPFRSINNEMKGVTGGHRGVTREVPHAEYLHDLKKNLPPVVGGLGAVYALALLVTARRRTAPEWATLIFPLAYLGMISCSPKVADRYLLPTSVLLPLLGVLGAAEIGRMIGSPHLQLRARLGLLVQCGLVVWLCLAEKPALARSYAGFQKDDPAAVAEWVKANLPADAVIAEDHRINLSESKAEGLSSDARVPQKVLDASFASDLIKDTKDPAKMLDALRAKGVTHVAVCKQNYGRYLRGDMIPQAEVKSGFDQRREFYRRVFEEGALLKEWPSGVISYLQPGIKFYRIVPEKTSGTVPAVAPSPSAPAAEAPGPAVTPAVEQ